jgi:predicted  nucleic acid-binding Zn-ribbon protein
MPHICTRCNNIFESGEDILKGCPVCGWKKFMFTRTASGTNGDQTQQIITRAMGVRVPPGGRAERRIEGRVEERAEVKAEEREVRVEELVRKPPERPFQPPAKGPEGSKACASSESIREAITEVENKKLEGKLESIKITAPGTYELNLPSLFEREELIMAVKEGTYFIDLSSAFRKGKKE